MIKLKDLLSEAVKIQAKPNHWNEFGHVILVTPSPNKTYVLRFNNKNDSSPNSITFPTSDTKPVDTNKAAREFWLKVKSDVIKWRSTNESVNEASDLKVYHKSYTEAIQTAKEYALKRGYMVDDDDSFRKIGMGPKRPSEGKTNKVSVELSKGGKPSNKQLHIQVYGMKNGYELNCYIG